MKYIAEILSKFTMRQRLTVLLFLLGFLLLFTFGGKFISSLGYEETSLRSTVKFQKSEIDTLKMELAISNKQILRIQKECTDNAIERERRVMEQIEALEKMVKEIPSYSAVRRLESIPDYYTSDTVVVSARQMTTPEPYVKKEEILNSLKNLKRSIKN
jgi:hypothetical protein